MKTYSYPEVGWMKERFQVLLIDEHTCTFDWTIEPGGSVPEHCHQESDEHFTIISGALSMCIAGQWTPIQDGGSLTIPRMTYHSLRNSTSQPVICRVSFTPVVDQGKFFQILFFLKHLNPKDPMALFKALYISDQLNYREFSTPKGSTRTIMVGILRTFRLFAPLTGWNKLIRKFVQHQHSGEGSDTYTTAA
ncbi:MAG: cupin domain-containing protein [Lewinellaceae bacterium]|nr:cupin domain-containing protein [Lewinellaceae bacterium]